ncbi:hypothetical protein H0O01_04765 [Candidatus Micrarchaeota archaeon]|nr:hypothetical protein [Candidatus Micrarchaeota archaeon]
MSQTQNTGLSLPQKLLLAYFSANIVVMFLVLIKLSTSVEDWSDSLSIDSMLSGTFFTFFFLVSLAGPLISHFFSRKIKSIKYGDIILMAFLVYIPIFGFSASFLARNTMVFIPFLLLWVISEVLAFKEEMLGK